MQLWNSWSWEFTIWIQIYHYEFIYDFISMKNIVKSWQSTLASAQVEAWLEGLLLQLALAGPAGDLKNALVRRCLGCFVADCVWPSQKIKPGMERSGPTPFFSSLACWPGGSGAGGAPTAVAVRLCCWTATTLHMLVTNFHDLFNRHACACLFMSGLRLSAMCSESDSTCPFYLTVLAGGQQGPSLGGVLGKEVLELPPKSPALNASQTLHVFSRWTVTTWPASLGWPSGQAGATREGHRACFIRRARVGGPSRRHAQARGQTTWS